MNGESVSLSDFDLKRQLASKKTLGSMPYVATRMQSWCSYWLAAMVIGACFEVVLAYNSQISYVGLVIAIYALQGAVTEYSGIRIEAASVCIPLRPLPRLPMFTFWSKRIYLSEIDSIRVKAPLFGVERALVRTLTGHDWHVYFSGRESRLWFLYLVEELQPKIIIYRRR